MKHNYLGFKLSMVLLLGVLAYIPLKNSLLVRQYIPREAIEKPKQMAGGAIEYLAYLRANPETGIVNPVDVLNAQKEVSQLSRLKSATGSWEFVGPDNIGGRTRALLIDKDNSDIMFAGGVSGGLWKSVSNGQYWTNVEYQGATNEDFANIAISTICQSTNGDIYFGTGEGFLSSPGQTPNGDGGSGMVGQGIWKSTDGGTSFVKLASTYANASAERAFSIVYELAADPTNANTIYAGTLGGLKVSTDGGETWTNAVTDQDGYNISYGYDVKAASNGTVVASIRNRCFVKKPNESIFQLRSSDEGDKNWINSSNIGRLEFAISPQDPNFIYCIAATADGVPNSVLRNIYKSVDGGDTWVIIGKGGSNLFQPLGGQGCYDMAIIVDASDKNHVFTGGIDVYEGRAVATGDLFSWSQLSFWSAPLASTRYVHADQHNFVFDPKNPKIFYITSDGGISRCYIGRNGLDYEFLPMNKNYNVTQFYSVAANGLGHVLGGTQDNGTLIVNGVGNTTRNGSEVWGGDGGHSAMSTINSSIGFGTIYYGGLYRNVDENYADWNMFYSSDMLQVHWGGSNWFPKSSEGSFVTPIAYWETDNDPLSTTQAWFECNRTYKKDTVLELESFNIADAPIKVKLEKEYKKGDTIYYDDNYQSLFALGMTRTLWITRSAANFSTGQLTNNDWWCAVPRNIFSANETITQLKFSADGNHLFFSTNASNLFRLSNLNEARDVESGAAATGIQLTPNDEVKTVVTKIAGFSGRTITGLAVDPKNIDNLIVTIGNYGYNDFIYLCATATTCGASTSKVNFTNITSNLPKAPAYCAVIDLGSSNGKVLVGTEFGVYSANNVIGGAPASISWTPFNEGLAPVPVFQMFQQTKGWPWTSRKGEIYIGTHGLGFFKNSSLLTSEPETLAGKGTNGNSIDARLFPNPVIEDLTIEVSLKQNAILRSEVYNLNGQLLYESAKSQGHSGLNTLSLNLSDLPHGVYLVKVYANQNYTAQRILKK